jgi:hypothetical protein
MNPMKQNSHIQNTAPLGSKAGTLARGSTCFFAFWGFLYL